MSSLRVTGRSMAATLLVLLGGCGGKASLPEGPTSTAASPTPPPPTPAPTPTPTGSCIANVTELFYDPDHAECPFSGGILVVTARFNLTAAATQSIKVLSVSTPNLVFTFGPVEVGAGRTERINIRSEFECIKIISPRGWWSFGAFTLNTSCGPIPLTEGNRLADR